MKEGRLENIDWNEIAERVRKTDPRIQELNREIERLKVIQAVFEGKVKYAK